MFPTLVQADDPGLKTLRFAPHPLSPGPEQVGLFHERELNAQAVVTGKE